MSVARAEAELATVLLIELMAVITEEDERDTNEPTAPSVSTPEPVAAVA